MELKLVQGLCFQRGTKSLGEEFCVNANCSYDFQFSCKGCSDIFLSAKLILSTDNKNSLEVHTVFHQYWQTGDFEENRFGSL